MNEEPQHSSSAQSSIDVGTNVFFEIYNRKHKKPTELNGIVVEILEECGALVIQGRDGGRYQRGIGQVRRI